MTHHQTPLGVDPAPGFPRPAVRAPGGLGAAASPGRSDPGRGRVAAITPIRDHPHGRGAVQLDGPAPHVFPPMLWSGHLPWTLSYAIPLPMQVRARACPDCPVSYQLGIAGCSWRIRRIEWRGSRQIVRETATPTPRDTVEHWWKNLLAGRAV